MINRFSYIHWEGKSIGSCSKSHSPLSGGHLAHGNALPCICCSSLPSLGTNSTLLYYICPCQSPTWKAIPVPLKLVVLLCFLLLWYATMTEYNRGRKGFITYYRLESTIRRNLNRNVKTERKTMKTVACWHALCLSCCSAAVRRLVDKATS